jgi:transcriptional regulator with GAF, ATPase, and Fis domain
MAEQARRESYVDRVRADTRQYAKELLEENEKLRGMLLGLGEQAAALRSQLESARQELDHYREKGSRMQEQLLLAEADSRRFVERYVEVERENSNLANLYVASYRLHSTLDRDEVIAVIHEILANLVGCEEALVLETSPDGASLVPVSAQGIEWTGPVPVGEGLIGRTVASGERYVAAERAGAGSSDHDANVTACIPLKLGDKLVGALVLFRLLPQKQGFEDLDRELFDLLATHAAMALHCSAPGVARPVGAPA